MRELPTLLGPTVHRGKDTTHKSLKTMRNERALPQQCWKSCANGTNIFALRFGDHGTKKMLGVVGWKVWPVSNFAQQHATTSNNMQQGVQTDVTCNIQQCWELLVNNVASVCTQPYSFFMFSCFNDNDKDYFTNNERSHNCNTRSASKININYPRTNYGKFSNKYRGAQLLNSRTKI